VRGSSASQGPNGCLRFREGELVWAARRCDRLEERFLFDFEELAMSILQEFSARVG